MFVGRILYKGYNYKEDSMLGMFFFVLSIDSWK